MIQNNELIYKTKIMKKSEIIDGIIEELKNNMFESKEYIFDLVRESLQRRTVKELKQINA